MKSCERYRGSAKETIKGVEYDGPGNGVSLEEGRDRGSRRQSARGSTSTT